MSESADGAAGTATRPPMTPHEMLAASARLGSHRDSMVRGTVPAYPQQYDESGFPIRTDSASLASRVRRLLRG